MSNLENFYHHEYWKTNDGRSLLDIRRGHLLISLITQDIKKPASPFITLRGENSQVYEGWYISWMNFEERTDLTIEFEKEEICIYAMEKLEFTFYHSLVFPQALEENPDYKMDNESKLLTKESLNQAIKDAREWMNKNHHLFVDTDQDNEKHLHSTFLL